MDSACAEFAFCTLSVESGMPLRVGIIDRIIAEFSDLAIKMIALPVHLVRNWHLFVYLLICDRFSHCVLLFKNTLT